MANPVKAKPTAPVKMQSNHAGNDAHGYMDAMSQRAHGQPARPGHTTSKALVKAAPAGMVNSPAVSRATGFTTGNQVIKATKSNPVTTSVPKVAPTVAPKGNSVFDQVGGFIQNRVDQMTGKIATPISGAMKNPTPVIPCTQKNVQAIQKATKRP